MSIRAVASLCALILLGAACGSSSTASSQAPAAPSPSISAWVESPSPTPTPTPIESPWAQPGAPPATITVAFSGLQRGVYPTHLHSRCSGLQAYHLIVLQSLVIGPDGAGSVEVSSSYFGRGYCVIVYSSPSLATVAANRQI